MIKVIGFNGSPRSDGNTFIAIQTIFAELEKENIKTDLIHIGEELIHGCKGCNICKKSKNRFCASDNDILNSCLEKMYESEGIIIGSPVYFGSVTPPVKALIERTGCCARAGGFLLKRKICTSVVAVRRQGAVDTLNQINNLFYVNQTIMPFSLYWNIGIGREKGEVKNDKEGMETFRVLGENMAWLLKKINY